MGDIRNEDTADFVNVSVISKVNAKSPLVSVDCSTSCNTNESKMAHEVAYPQIIMDRGRAMELVPPDVRDTAMALAFDIAHYVSKLKTNKLKPANSKYAKTLRRTVDEVSEKHDILFRSMANKLEVNEETAHATIDNIANEMLSDHRFNWGRLVTLYAFCGRLAKYCVDMKKPHLAEKIADYTGCYIADNLSDAIFRNGGWAAFEDFFPESQNMENSIWRGLIYTVVGLGAIATMVSVR